MLRDRSVTCSHCGASIDIILLKEPMCWKCKKCGHEYKTTYVYEDAGMSWYLCERIERVEASE